MKKLTINTALLLTILAVSGSAMAATDASSTQSMMGDHKKAMTATSHKKHKSNKKHMMMKKDKDVASTSTSR